MTQNSQHLLGKGRIITVDFVYKNQSIYSSN